MRKGRDLPNTTVGRAIKSQLALTIYLCEEHFNLFLRYNSHENILRARIVEISREIPKDQQVGWGRSQWLPLMAIVLVVLGTLFRFISLDRQVSWFDEAYTAFRISGYSAVELAQHVQQRLAGSAMSVPEFLRELQRFQQVNAYHGIADTVRGLATEEAVLTPVYYILARLWAGIFGTSIAALRSLPATISLFVFPCAYWFCWELTGQRWMGWVAIALMSVAPFQILYAQEARPYSLWMVATLVCSAALLRSLRSGKRQDWALYALTLSFAFYSYLLSLFVAVAHGIYLLAIGAWRSRKILLPYIIASTVAFLSFSPWLFVIFSNRRPHTADLLTLIDWLKFAVVNLRRTFVDVGLGIYSPGTVIDYFLTVPCLVLAIAAMSFLILGRNPLRERSFLLCLILIPGMILIILDLKLTAFRSLVMRYQIPVFMGIQLAVAYLLSEKMFPRFALPAQRQFWRSILVIVITFGMLSGAVISQANASWMRYYAAQTPQLANIINRSPNPLVLLGECAIADSVCVAMITWNGWALAHSLAPDVKIALVLDEQIPVIDQDPVTPFVYLPTTPLQKKLEQYYQLQQVQKGVDAWQLLPKYVGRRD